MADLDRRIAELTAKLSVPTIRPADRAHWQACLLQVLSDRESALSGWDAIESD